MRHLITSLATLLFLLPALGRAADGNLAVGQASSLPFAADSQARSLRHGTKPTAARLRAQAGIEENFQWDSWRHLPVLEGGRPKPFDTLAWETTRALSNRARMPDPGSAQKLQPHTFYLAMLFEWPGWGQPAVPRCNAWERDDLSRSPACCPASAQAIPRVCRWESPAARPSRTPPGSRGPAKQYRVPAIRCR